MEDASMHHVCVGEIVSCGAKLMMLPFISVTPMLPVSIIVSFVGAASMQCVCVLSVWCWGAGYHGISLGSLGGEFFDPAESY